MFSTFFGNYTNVAVASRSLNETELLKRGLKQFPAKKKSMFRNETGAMNAFKINNTDNRSKSTLLWSPYYQMLKISQDSVFLFIKKKNKTKKTKQKQKCRANFASKSIKPSPHWARPKTLHWATFSVFCINEKR